MRSTSNPCICLFDANGELTAWKSRKEKEDEEERARGRRVETTADQRTSAEESFDSKAA